MHACRKARVRADREQRERGYPRCVSSARTRRRHVLCLCWDMLLESENQVKRGAQVKLTGRGLLTNREAQDNCETHVNRS
ncbi:hypothetical protein BDA96_10G320800 [Sorghum bicolor]|uniref:Uncharacterized protein n=1 Tax=Sorghum bicolor TaxID=4558 RepID=A0A921Q8P5_SORBI|nr:hypothetical protein BDA96_10G320800 [Sorghum bicolor]